MAYFAGLGALLPYILLAGLLLLAVVMFLAGYWLILPGLAGLPWRPTSSARIRKALEVARLQPGETIYDLGSGDGRVLVMAAREFQARAVGVEISPIYCLVGRFSAQMHGLEGLVRVVHGDFFTTDLSGADVVFAYMTSRQAARLKPVLDRQLQQGALLRFQEHVIKGTESVSPLIKTRVAALDRLLDHRTPDRFVCLALLG